MAPAETIAKALGGRKAGGGWMARCPAHDDHEPSLSIRHADHGKALVHCLGGCDQDRVIAALRSRGLWTENGPSRFTRPAPPAAAANQPDRDAAKRSEAATACETALWPAGTFWAAYCGNRHEAVEGVIDADTVAAAVRTVMTEQTEWTGTASDLLGALAHAAGERIAKSKTWPDGPRALSGRLRRAATFLRKIGIEVAFERQGRARTRVIRITAAPNPVTPECSGARPSAPSAASAPEGKPKRENTFGLAGSRTLADHEDTGWDELVPTVHAKVLKPNGGTAAVEADAKRPAQSGPGETVAGGWRARL